jgi:mRNA export factor
VSSLSWSPSALLLAATSWDCTARMWEISPQGQSNPKAHTKAGSPILTSAFAPQAQQIVLGESSGKVQLWDLGSNAVQTMGTCGGGVSMCVANTASNVVVTGSWDKSVKYWDLRSPQPVASVDLPERVFCGDTVGNLTVVGSADQKYTVFDMRKPSTPYKHEKSPLKHQLRSIACFPNQTGFLIGTIEGRCAVQHVEPAMQSSNFTFKCHREQSRCYSVNAMSFHPLGTFATAGSDGTFNFWDKDSRNRLKPFKKMSGPVSAGKFSADGSIYAYAVSYDWHKGQSGYDPNQKPRVYVHGVAQADVAPRIKK